ncbi:hypothetical protein BZA05DRAFT_391653 [Tricharina praecox]|uniref:uncharacterized protein n=1 Tax=Tricharina praecox TaxID=43433 RepID=UPI00221FEA83|nr:uncharacterized protein BZA05DRAFT_391653 [Tricharina praecox]KAI5855462.1 hypothetical protein BZA05DRAFT_391653 [Tricharina praecox]
MHFSILPMGIPFFFLTLFIFYSFFFLFDFYLWFLYRLLGAGRGWGGFVVNVQFVLAVFFSISSLGLGWTSVVRGRTADWLAGFCHRGFEQSSYSEGVCFSYMVLICLLFLIALLAWFHGWFIRVVLGMGRRE